MSADYPDFRDPGVAAAAVNDPRTPPAALQQIAAMHPGLRARVATHPAVYPELVAWLRSLHDPAVDAALGVGSPKRGAGKVVAIVVAVVVVIAGGGTAFAAANGWGPFGGRPVPSVSATPQVREPTPTPTTAPTSAPVPKTVWEGGTKQAWSASLSDLGFQDYMDSSVSLVSPSAWLTWAMAGDVTVQTVAVDPASGKALWNRMSSGWCAEKETANGLVCLDGDWGRLDLLAVDLATGKNKRLASTAAWKWPAEMVAREVVPVGDDVIVTATQVLSGTYDNWKAGDTWVARIAPDGKPVWNQRFAKKTVDCPEAYQGLFGRWGHIAHGLYLYGCQAIDIETGKSVLGTAGFPRHVVGFAADAVLLDADAGKQTTNIVFPDGTSGVVMSAGDATYWQGQLVPVLDAAEQPSMVLAQTADDCKTGTGSAIRAIDPAAGPEEVWSTPVEVSADPTACGGAVSPTIGAYQDGLFALLDDAGTVTVLDAQTGELRWRAELGPEFGRGNYPHVGFLSDGSVLVSVSSGESNMQQYAILGASTGKVVQSGNGWAAAVPGQDAIVLVGMDEGISRLVPA